MPGSIIALDVGEQRVGLAIARSGLSVAFPLATLERSAADFWEQLLQVMKQNDASDIVIGLPRGLDGQETAQTAAVQAFAKQLTDKIDLQLHWQDEAVTSIKAEDVLKHSGQPYAKGDIDAVAASLILTDFLETRKVSK